MTDRARLGVAITRQCYDGGHVLSPNTDGDSFLQRWTTMYGRCRKCGGEDRSLHWRIEGLFIVPIAYVIAAAIATEDKTEE